MLPRHVEEGAEESADKVAASGLPAAVLNVGDYTLVWITSALGSTTFPVTGCSALAVSANQIKQSAGEQFRRYSAGAAARYSACSAGLPTSGVARAGRR